MHTPHSRDCLNCFIRLCLFALLLPIVNNCCTSHGAIVYTFSGQVPTITNPLSPLIDTHLDTHPFVEPGETWVATLIIDENTPVTQLQNYAAVKGGSLRFSGGYVAPETFAGATVRVVNVEGDGLDGISIDAQRMTDGTWAGVHLQAISNLNPFSSRNLPGPGINLAPSPSSTETGWSQLDLRDSFGRVSYTAALSNNVSFAVTVPEPTTVSMTALAVLAASPVAGYRRQRVRRDLT